MKQHIDLEQVYDFAKEKKNLIKLAKATRNDYDGMIKGTILFDQVDSKTAVIQIFKTICLDYTIGQMIEIIKAENMCHIKHDSKWKVCVLNKDLEEVEFESAELCDALWNAVMEIL